ncbi:hypothetical protein Hypma_001413 [Hypsizygus marmoreus]|uniref:Uncharacterized protein n=1 Tax=Hypsizygus marmoreus TaxID=39966 RepID=A0A369K8X6_HYPMA|nr:hypothetical protein Hypma_001413 [Hypsizygus marmoreus]
MGSLCLSTASILRCESFSRLQVILIIVPTALEVILSTSLIFTNWGTGRTHLWLTAEGWIYFALALLEMFSHILPAVRDNPEIFKALDTVLAATSFLPIFFYIVFIFLFSRAELVDSLPSRFQTISKLLLLFFIPTIVALNEVSSFVGITRRIVNFDSRPILALGFSSKKDQLLWTFFTSITLALLAVYQTINFTFAFYRLVRAFLERRRIETTSSDETHLFKGIGWITGGLQLGAIETVMGFAGCGFGGALSRRILRLLARAFLCIGVAKGMDSVEDFNKVREELSGQDFRHSRLREFISNPRLSTFHQLTPTATAFHATPRAPHGISQLNPLSQGGLPGMKQFADVKQFSSLEDESEKLPRQRVTVNFEKGVPSLHLRFSALDIPTPVFNIKSRPVSEWVAISRPMSYRPASNHPPSRPASSLLSSLVISESGPDLTSPPRAYNPVPKPSRIESSYSTKSIPESYTSLSAVRELASQFPPLPVHAVVPVHHPSAREKPADFWDDAMSVETRRSSLSKSQVVSHNTIDPFSGEDDFINVSVVPATIPLGQPIRTLRNPSAQFNDVSVPTSAVSTSMTILSGYSQTPQHQSALTADMEDGMLDFGTALDTGKSRSFTRNSGGGTHPADWIDYDAIKPLGELAPISEGSREQSRAPSYAGSTRQSEELAPRKNRVFR